MSTDKPDQEIDGTGKDAQLQNKGFDTVGLLLSFLSNWKWFVLSVAICMAAAYYYVSTIIPTYTVEASVYLNDENGASQSKEMLGLRGNSDMTMSDLIDETEIKLLRSRNNLIKIVDSLDLAYSYYNVGKLRDIPVYKNSAVLASLDSTSLANLSNPITVTIDKNKDGTYDVNTTSVVAGGTDKRNFTVKKLPARINLADGTLTLRESPYTKRMNGTEKIVINNPNAAAARLAEGLDMGYARNSRTILLIAINTPMIEEGRDVLKVLIKFYNRQMIEDKNRAAIQTEAFILDRLMMISGELRDVEDRLRDYRLANNVIDISAQTNMNLNQRSTSESELASVDAQREILNDIEHQVVRQDSYGTIPSVSNDPALTQSINQYNTAVANYEHALQSMGKDHPQIEKLQENLNLQKQQIISNIGALKRDMTVRRRSIASIDSRSAGQLSAQPTVDKGLNEIFREQQVKVNIYTFLLQKREEIALQKTMATPTAQFIDNPQGYGPVKPKRSIYLLVSLLIGLLIPAIIITLKRIIFPKFNDKEELQRLTAVPILGEVCQAETTDPVVVGESVSTPIAEMFRLLRNNINFTRARDEKSTILVTSSISGEGKTFLSLNLAMTYALTGKRIVVVGLDIRRPVLAHTCGMTNSSGVTTFLAGQEKDIDKLLRLSPFNDNLYVLPAGPIPPNPNELLMNENCTELFNRLREKFDYVIVDSAPMGLVSDTQLIVAHTDVQLFVTRANYTTPGGLNILHEAINSGRLPHAYIVINGVDVASNAYIYRRYGHYGYYGKTAQGYSYGYSSASENREHHHHHHHKKPSLWQRIFKSSKRK